MSEDRFLNAKKQWETMGFGMFVHFGLSTFEGQSCGSGKCSPLLFNPTDLDIGSWADIAYHAGMNYAVLTAKHVDGFCLWPSKYTEYSVKNATCSKDIVREFAEQFRARGLKVGLYYALWDNNCEFYRHDARYAEYVRCQVEELLTQYGDIVELWFDGAWDKEHPTKEWMYDPAWEQDPMSGLRHGEAWEWDKLYELIHSLQPNCMVINNASSDRPGGIKYFPLDVRTVERVNYIYQNRVCRVDTRKEFVDPKGQTLYLPLEYCNTLTPDWFYQKDQHVLHPSVETICGWYSAAREQNGNFLLNLGPDIRGRIPEYHLEFLYGASKRLNLERN